MSKSQRDSVFTQDKGVVQLGGMDAIVRLTLDQVRVDARRGLKTGMFISGYRGSPVGLLDQALMRQDKLLQQHHIHFVDGLNEDLAATAVWGTQMLHAVGKKKFDGVTGLWYGKAPGVDRSGDALKHANYTGIDMNGGVLAIAGDDPSCKSSSLASQSEPMLYHVGIPSLYPSNVQEILDFGLHGYQMSRAAGLWVGMKLVTSIADGHGVAEVDLDRLTFDVPALEWDGKPFAPRMNLGMNVRLEALEMERSLYEARHEMARAYARANRLNRIELRGDSDWLGIVAAGKTYTDLRQALQELGLSEGDLRRYGVRLLKVGMLFPLEPTIVREFASGLEEMLVLEEKRPFLELFIKDILYGSAGAPRVIGKQDETRKEFLPRYGEFEPETIARAVAERLGRKARIESVEAWLRRMDEISSRKSLPVMARTAWYCSGCPHNSSTRPVEGSVVSAGIGCHTMSMWMDRNVVMGTHMGAEGAQWIGMAPFTGVEHIFQNMGDGTYFHSGVLAIRYAAATDANITFKLLYNGHVSMTGGQEAMGRHPVADVVQELLASGVKEVIVTTDDPTDYDGVRMPAGTVVWHRDRLDEAQRKLASVRGTTVLIHEQECAAELRRLRAKGKRPVPVEHVVINERVCEGCGDCGEKSNCMSVEPVSTEFGRKTRIHDSSCNKDFSCLKGFCPSFVTVTPAAAASGQGQIKGKAGRLPAMERQLPAPTPLVEGDAAIHIMGIGGTGTVTVAAILGQAARIDGKYVCGLDQTGLAQKGGAVISDLKMASAPIVAGGKISNGSTDLYLAFDILTAADGKQLEKCSPQRTVAVVSTTASPTGQMVARKDVTFPAANGLRRSIDAVTRAADNVYLDGQAIALGLFGDAMATNLLMVGVAYQAGALPLTAEGIEEAVRRQGVAVDMGLLAFRWGRLAVIDPDYVLRQVQAATVVPAPPRALPDAVKRVLAQLDAPASLAGALELRAFELVAYQNESYAIRYLEVVQRALAADVRLGGTRLGESVARSLYKLMAYKDEYEVARLHTDPTFREQLQRQFPSGYSVTYHLAPPLLAKRDRVSGELQKRRYGPWMFQAMKVLARLKFLRGTAADVFGYTAERRLERQLIEGYVKLVDEVCTTAMPGNCELARRLLSWPLQAVGYGHVKEKNLGKALEQMDRQLAEFRRAKLEVAVGREEPEETLA